MFNQTVRMPILSQAVTLSATVPQSPDSAVRDSSLPGANNLIVPAPTLSSDERAAVLSRVQSNLSSLTEQHIRAIRGNLAAFSDAQVLHLARGFHVNNSASLPADLQSEIAGLRKDVATRLLGMLGSGSYATRQSATTALVGLGPDVAATIQAESPTPNAEIEGRRRQILGQIIDGHASSLARMLTHGTPQEQLSARRELIGHMGRIEQSSYARSVLLSFHAAQEVNLFSSLQDGPPQARAEAIQTLEQRGFRPVHQIQMMLQRGTPAALSAASFVVDHLFDRCEDASLPRESRLDARYHLGDIHRLAPRLVAEGAARFHLRSPMLPPGTAASLLTEIERISNRFGFFDGFNPE